MIRRTVAAVAVLALAACAVAAVWAWHALWRPLDNPEPLFEVTEDATGRDVLASLHDRDLMPSELAGRLYLRLFAADRHLLYGRYRVAATSRPADILEKILSGEVETLTLTVVEGSLAEEVAELCALAGLGTEDEWNDLISRGALIHDVAPDAKTLEGFLFPDTYRFALGLPAAVAIEHMIDRFRTVWREEAKGELWATPLELVTLASLVEAETSVPGERARIAGVFANRLRRGMLLQCDPTVVYALKRRGEWHGRLLRRHWQTDDPYNTYRYPGLPPGPINNPGRAAIAAAISPESHDALYFVAAPGGGHTFSRTLREHERAVAVWLRSKRERPGNLVE